MIIITTALRETPIETTAIIGNILKNRLNKLGLDSHAIHSINGVSVPILTCFLCWKYKKFQVLFQKFHLGFVAFPKKSSTKKIYILFPTYSKTGRNQINLNSDTK